MKKTYYKYFCIVTITFSNFFLTAGAYSQEDILETPREDAQISLPIKGIYFADVLVRGKPIFQVGSIGELSARQRAAIINRRIASVLARSDNSIPKITVKPDDPRKIAILQVNDRIIMTVTNQDGEDFGLSVENLAQKRAEQLNLALEKPPLAIDASQRLYSSVRQIIQSTIGNLPSLLGSIVAVIFTWGAARIVRYAAFTWAKQTEGDASTEILIGRLCYGGVWVIGSIVALGVLGIDFAALLGALGLTSVAIGFSLKDVLSNYISGVILLAAKPFRINDQVAIGDYEGTITQIQLRATTMKTYDGRLVYIPNQAVFQTSIINNTASPRRRSSIIVGIDYSENIDRAKQIIIAVLDRLEQVEKNPSADILVSELAASTVNLEIRFWVDSRRAGFLATTSLVTQAVKEALESAKIDMPTEIYTLVFRGDSVINNGVSK
ncbi:MAG: mechanosensitive ion channel family protein [Prochloraceae cyanobacterium]